jgi:hypothetical protein
MRRKKAIIVGIVSAALFVGGAAFGLDALDKAYPPPLEAAQQRSFEVLDRDGRLLRAFATPDGRWRLKTSVFTTITALTLGRCCAPPGNWQATAGSSPAPRRFPCRWRG